MRKVLKWIGVVAVALIVIAVIFGEDKKGATESGAAAAEPPQPPVLVTADELLQAYKENEVAANEKYKGKPFIVSARVSSIEAEMGNEPYRVLAAGGEFEFNSPQARLANDQKGVAASLKKGQKVTLQCVGNSEIAGTPMLKDCRIQPS